MENKSLFHTKDVTLKLLHGYKQDRLVRQIATALISFNSFFNWTWSNAANLPKRKPMFTIRDRVQITLKAINACS